MHWSKWKKLRYFHLSLLLCSALLPLFICGKLQEVQAAALYQCLERKEDSEKKMWGNISICLAFASWPGAEGKHQGEQSTGLVNGEVLLLPCTSQPLFAACFGGQQWLPLQEHYLPASKGMKSSRVHLVCILTIILSFPRTTKACRINKKLCKIKLSTFQLRCSEKLGSHSAKHL